ncbi:nucleotidyltransferase family protein [Desulfonatronovibrio magnus]|uniref:nucleotidyltransferase family protein n=1 Tax=Desulfonatronovibrio magnus TaxID=698827 RepID=UPI0005EBB6A6|nr:nucleotidyltransferase domain-containing protein [Desulfonatronovibrio magnus]
MDTQEAITLARDYVCRVKQILEFDSAYLFGSYAAGHQDQNSDVDVGIIVSKHMKLTTAPR